MAIALFTSTDVIQQELQHMAIKINLTVWLQTMISALQMKHEWLSELKVMVGGKVDWSYVSRCL